MSCSIVYIEYILYSLYYISIAIISYLQLHYIYLYNICYILYVSGSRGTWYLGGMAELSISTTDDDTCGDLCKYRCGNCQGSLEGLQITAYAISEGSQRHQSLSLSLRPSSVRHFQFSMLPGTLKSMPLPTVRSFPSGSINTVTAVNPRETAHVDERLQRQDGIQGCLYLKLQSQQTIHRQSYLEIQGQHGNQKCPYIALHGQVGLQTR